MSYSPVFSSAFIIIHSVPARITVGLGTIYFSNMGTFIHKMLSFWEHLQHAIANYKVRVNTINMIFCYKKSGIINLAGQIQNVDIYFRLLM